MKHIIGLTGQSGSGKSIIASIMKNYDFEVLDCDEIAHKNMEPGAAAYKDIVDNFGYEILNPDKTINRKVLGAIVFNDKAKLLRLNEITHRRIYKYIEEKIWQTDKNIVIDAPLLFEAGLDRLCTHIWSAVCSKSASLKRIMKRDNISQKEAEARLKNQKSAEFFRERSDVVFDNSGDIEKLRERVIYEVNKISD